MKYKKESLEKLLLLIDELFNEPENNWFKEELSKMTESPTLTLDKNELCFDSFVRLQRKMFRLKANEFYKNLTDADLQKELIKDYQEMLWFKMLNQIDRYYLFIYYQMENMLNFFILKNDAFNRIKSDPGSYQLKFTEGFIVKCYSYFFNKDGKANEINKINSVWAKLVFWSLEANEDRWIIDKKQTLDNIINVRNLLSHKNSSQQNSFVKNQIELWKKGDDSLLSFPISVLNKLKRTVLS